MGWNATKQTVIDMKTLNVSISDSERRKYRINDDEIGFSELVDLVSRELMHQSLDKSVRLAGQYGLSSMTLDEINDEIAAVRNAKDHS
jgi:hypothetical protein